MIFKNSPTFSMEGIEMEFDGTDEFIEISDVTIGIEQEAKKLTEEMESMSKNETSKKQPKFIENDTLVLLGD